MVVLFIKSKTKSSKIYCIVINGLYFTRFRVVKMNRILFVEKILII